MGCGVWYCGRHVSTFQVNRCLQNQDTCQKTIIWLYVLSVRKSVIDLKLHSPYFGWRKPRYAYYTRVSRKPISNLCSQTFGHSVILHTVRMYSGIGTVRNAMWCRGCDVLATSLSFCCLHRIRAQTFVHRKLRRVIVSREKKNSLSLPIRKVMYWVTIKETDTFSVVVKRNY